MLLVPYFLPSLTQDYTYVPVRLIILDRSAIWRDFPIMGMRLRDEYYGMFHPLVIDDQASIPLGQLLILRELCYRDRL